MSADCASTLGSVCGSVGLSARTLASQYHALETSRAVSTTQGEGYEVQDHRYDVVAIGADGAVPRAAVGLVSHELKTACITKVFPARSHTVTA